MAKTKKPFKKPKNYDLKAILKAKSEGFKVNLKANTTGSVLPQTDSNFSLAKDGLILVLDSQPKPFNNTGKWVKSQDVKIGDWVQASGKIGQVQEIEVTKVPQPIDVYNIEVEGNHNYFANGVLVHNAGPEYKAEDITVLHGSVEHVDSLVVAAPDNRDLLSESLTDLIEIVGRTPNLTFMQHIQFSSRLSDLQSNVSFRGWNAKAQTDFEQIKKELDTALKLRAIETNNYSLYTSTEQRIETANYVGDILRDEMIDANEKDQQQILKELNYWEKLEGDLRNSLVSNTNQEQTKQAFLITDLLMLIAAPEEKVTQSIIEKPLEKLIGKYSPTLFKLIQESPLAKLIIRSTREEALHLKQYSAIAKGPLSEIAAGEMKIAGELRQVSVAETFRGGSYVEYVAQEEITLYRVFSDSNKDLNRYWSRTKPAGPSQASLDYALAPEFNNKATQWVEIKVPKGTKLYEGTATKVESKLSGQYFGGGNQVYIDADINRRWEVTRGIF
jgi:hypothetical protein